MTDTLKRPADDAPSADAPSPAKRPKPPAKEKLGGGKKKDAKGKGKARAALTPEPEPEPPAANPNANAVASSSSSSSSTPQQNGAGQEDDAVPESTNSIMNEVPTITQSAPDVEENGNAVIIPNGDTDSMNVDADLDPETTSNRLTSLLRAQTSGEPTSSARAAEREAEIARLSGLLASHQTLLSSHQTALSTHQTLANSLAQSLTCQICLDLMYKPYALTPCGHVACYGCLVRWFVGGPMAGGGYSTDPAQRGREAEDPVGWVVNGGWGLPGGPGSEPTPTQPTSEPAPAASSSAPGTSTPNAGTVASTSTAASASGSGSNVASGPPLTTTTSPAAPTTTTTAALFPNLRTRRPVRAQPGAGGDTPLQSAQAAVGAIGRRMSERLRVRGGGSLAGAAGASSAAGASGVAGGSGANSNTNANANPPSVDADGGGSGQGQGQGLASRALQRQRERESAWATRHSHSQRERRHRAYRPTRYTHVPKTCPICRGRVSARPAEVWAIKDMVGSVVKSGVVDLPTSGGGNEEEEEEGKGKGKEKAKEKEKKKGDEKNPQNPTNDPWNNVFPPLPRPLSSRVPGSSSWFPTPDAYEYDHLLPRGWGDDYEMTPEEAEMMLAADAEAERQVMRRAAVPAVSLTAAERAQIGAQIEDEDIAERVGRGFYNRDRASRGPWGRRRVYAIDSEDDDDSEDDYGLGDGGFGVEEEDEGEEEFTDSEEEEEYLRDLDLVFGGARAAAARRYRRRGGPAVRVGGANANANAGGNANANPGPNTTLNDHVNAIANANLRARLPANPRNAARVRNYQADMDAIEAALGPLGGGSRGARAGAGGARIGGARRPLPRPGPIVRVAEPPMNNGPPESMDDGEPIEISSGDEGDEGLGGARVREGMGRVRVRAHRRVRYNEDEDEDEDGEGRESEDDADGFVVPDEDGDEVDSNQDPNEPYIDYFAPVPNDPADPGPNDDIEVEADVAADFEEFMMPEWVAAAQAQRVRDRAEAQRVDREQQEQERGGAQPSTAVEAGPSSNAAAGASGSNAEAVASGTNEGTAQRAPNVWDLFIARECEAAAAAAGPARSNHGVVRRPITRGPNSENGSESEGESEWGGVGAVSDMEVAHRLARRLEEQSRGRIRVERMREGFVGAMGRGVGLRGRDRDANAQAGPSSNQNQNQVVAGPSSAVARRGDGTPTPLDMDDVQSMGFHDQDDGVYRCVECWYEIVEGVCGGCGRVYGGHFDESHSNERRAGRRVVRGDNVDVDDVRSDDEDVVDEDDDEEWESEHEDDGSRSRVRPRRGGDVIVIDADEPEADEDEDEDSEYGGSFIDDGEEADGVAIDVDELSSDNEVRDVIMICSGDEDEEDEDGDEDGDDVMDTFAALNASRRREQARERDATQSEGVREREAQDPGRATGRRVRVVLTSDEEEEEEEVIVLDEEEEGAEGAQEGKKVKGKGKTAEPEADAEPSNQNHPQAGPSTDAQTAGGEKKSRKKRKKKGRKQTVVGDAATPADVKGKGKARAVDEEAEAEPSAGPSAPTKERGKKKERKEKKRKGKGKDTASEDGQSTTLTAAGSSTSATLTSASESRGAVQTPADVAGGAEVAEQEDSLAARRARAAKAAEGRRANKDKDA